MIVPSFKSARRANYGRSAQLSSFHGRSAQWSSRRANHHRSAPLPSFLCGVIAVAFLLFAPTAFGQANSVGSTGSTGLNGPAGAEKSFYDQVKAFSLGGGSATVSGLVLNRDRAQMTFTGTFYFATPVNGQVTGAVFVGDGKFSAGVPPSDFEKENVRRLLHADAVESDFNTAVLRFSDDTFEQLAQKPTPSQPDATAQKLGRDVEARVLKETGANLSARVAMSILNHEDPGFFFASFDGGKRGRFGFVLDYQTRVPVESFRLNGGEKGLIYKYESDVYNTEIWMAFYSQEDYQRGVVTYSDMNNQLDTIHYDLDVDLRENKKAVRLLARMQSQTKVANLRAVSFAIGESLGEFESERLKKNLRLQRARSGGSELSFAQEDWEGGFTVFLPADLPIGSKLDLELVLEGDFMEDPEIDCDCHYPRSTTSWYPRHGYLDRATFDITFRHNKKLKIASVGKRVSEAPDVETKDVVITKYELHHPVALVTFALAPFQRYSQNVRFDKGGVGDPITLEFNSLAGSIVAIKEDFMMAEMDNSLRYFTSLFGKYPYPVFGAAFHPYNFGQGFPTLLMIPNADNDSKYTYSFIAHETAHQWWGDVVTWRSYRDQWLSEGFAEYSRILYTGLRAGPGSREELISQARDSLGKPPRTLSGQGKGKLVEVGPIILGHGLNTTKTGGAYQTLIYNKGALVLRMLHFLMTDPKTGNGEPFFAMMRDFVDKYRDGVASTDDFRKVANAHFVQSPIARVYGLKSLDWFFAEWVYQSDLPTYRLEYHFEDQPDGNVLMSGNLIQEGAPSNWFMVLPVAIYFGKQVGYVTVHADGPKTPFTIKLPGRPSKVELDPQRWILSEKSSTKVG
jgi:hypothetical protein